MRTGVFTMYKLRLTDWASIAEVIGAVAVVISLIYVGIQVHENTEEVRASNRQQLVGRAHLTTGNVAGNPELSAVIAKVSNGDPLNTTEQTQYAYFIRAVLYDVQEAYLLYREERLDVHYWNTRSALFDVYVDRELARQVYIKDKDLGLLHEDFVRWADRALEKN